MRITDILSIAENDQLPHRIRCVARALLIAMLALDRYGHTISYRIERDGASEAERDAGRFARDALQDIRALELPLGRRQVLSRLFQQRRYTIPKRLRRLLAKRQHPATVRRTQVQR
jgi:hypothetical protein